MSEPISPGVDFALRRLLEQPSLPLQRNKLPYGPRTLHVSILLVDTLQIIVFGLMLLPLFPAAQTTFAMPQACALGVLASAMSLAIQRALRAPHSVRLEYTHVVATRAAVAIFTAVLLLSAICWVTLSQSVTPNPQGRSSWFLTWAIASSLVAGGLRYGVARFAARLEYAQRILIIGAPDHVNSVANMIESASYPLWKIVGKFDDRVAGALDSAIELVTRRGADLVVLALADPDAPARMAMICGRLADQPIRVTFALDASPLTGMRGISKNGLPIFDIAGNPHGNIDGLTKRALDFICAALGLVVLGPILMGVAIMIRLETPGPVLFRQWRFGLGSQPILVLKFRTMRCDVWDTTGALRTAARDSRVTRVGRFLRRTSIDELPQLFNVLRGDMSLVGPRPHPLHMRVDDVYYFEAVAHYRVRHLIRPGITGWAQVNGSRGAVDTLSKARRRLDLDLYYLEHWSLWLDFKIMLRTVLGGFLSMHAD